jgi:hypothetical protein
MAAPTWLAGRIAVAGTLLGCTVAIAACTSSSSGSPAPTSASPTYAGLTTAQAKAALLTEHEIGNGLSISDLRPQEYPLPCTPNAKPLSKIVAPVAHATQTWTNDLDSIEVTETINNYGDDSAVHRALELTEAGMRCSDGEIGPISVAIGKPQDLSHNIKAAVDGIEAWAMTSSRTHETVILAKIDTQLITMVFGELPNTPSNAIDAATIVQDAMAKVSEATQ